MEPRLYMKSMHSLCCLIPVCARSVTDERLSGLAVISIESDMARRLDMTDVINTSVTSKVRKKAILVVAEVSC